MNATIEKLQRYGLTEKQAREAMQRYGHGTISEAIEAGWEPTHRIEVTGLPVEYVMVLPAYDDRDDGPAFNPVEWVLGDNADWEVVDGEWRFQGDVAPVANATVTITEVSR
jgi:hypothetical protein